MCILRELYGAGVEKLRIEQQSFTVSVLVMSFNISIISIVNKNQLLSIKFDTYQSTNIGCHSP